jgi:RimJ/RimL family protein N-acetyltransferase
MIETERMRLKKATEQDIDTLLKWWNTPELMKVFGFPDGLQVTREYAEKRLKRKNHVLLIAFEKETDKPIGEFSYSGFDMDEGTLRIGMKIAEIDDQDQGYEKEGLKAFLFYLFESYALEAVLIDILDINGQAKTLYEHFGAQKVSLEKDYWINPEGTHYDVVFYRIPHDRFYEILNTE